jgi:transketolase
MRTTNRPTAFSLSRQGTRTLDPDAIPDDAIERGAYVLRDPDGDPDVILIATGTEVGLALDAADALRGELAARVVSMPCMDTFNEQDAAYRDSVLPPTLTARVAVEAGSPFAWHRWVGDAGEIIGMTDFGASAPAKDVYAHFGITAEAVADAARRVAGR